MLFLDVSSFCNEFKSDSFNPNCLPSSIESLTLSTDDKNMLLVTGTRGRGRREG